MKKINKRNWEIVGLCEIPHWQVQIRANTLLMSFSQPLVTKHIQHTFNTVRYELHDKMPFLSHFSVQNSSETVICQHSETSWHTAPPKAEWSHLFPPKVNTLESTKVKNYCFKAASGSLVLSCSKMQDSAMRKTKQHYLFRGYLSTLSSNPLCETWAALQSNLS